METNGLEQPKIASKLTMSNDASMDTFELPITRDDYIL